MTEEKKNQEQPKATDAWNEVGKQFQTLGKSLAAALNATIQDEKVQQDLSQMQAALDATAVQIKQKAQEVSDAAKSKEVEEETKKLGEQAQTAGQDLVKGVQPQLVGALKKMQVGLDKTINDLEQLDPAAASAEPTPTDAWNEVGQQFQTLGESLAAAVNTSVQDEKVQQELKKMQAELDATVAQIKQKVKEASDAAKSVDVEGEAKTLDEQVQAAGQELIKEIQPQLAEALKKMQASLDKIVKDLEQKDTASSAT